LTNLATHSDTRAENLQPKRTRATAKRIQAHPQSGQALSELIIFLPVIFVLLGAANTLYSHLSERQLSDSIQMDKRLNEFQLKEQIRRNRLNAETCALQPALSLHISKAERPENVDIQRAFSMATLRVACLGEATVRLGPQMAGTLWALYLQAPSETAGRALTQTLCPKTKLSSESLRASVRAATPLRSLREASQWLQIEEHALTICRKPSIPVTLLDRLVPAILDR
jgi:hypothetical protein